MAFQWFKDSFQNFITGLGTYKDKSVAHTPVLNILPPQYLMNLYRGDWLSRKIIDIPAFDSTRAWRSWQAEQDQIEALEFAERSLNLQNKLMHAFIRARLWGGSLVVMGVDGQGGFDEPLDYNKVKKGDLKFVHSVGRWELGVGPLIRDITSPWYGQPEYYSRNNVEVGTSPDRNIKLPPQLLSNRTGSFFYMHPSRCIRLTGLDYPDIELAPDSWGDSVLQIVYKAISDTDLVTSAIASIVSEMKYDVIKVPGLTSKMATDEGAKQLAARFGQASLMKGTANSILIDSTEEWIQMQTRVNGFDKVMQMYLLLACGAADIPATRIYGREPAGQNATGESDVRNYYDRLSSEQAVKITPTLTPLDEVLIRSTFGDRDPDIYYQWNPLWQMDEDQKSQIALRKAQAHKIDVDAGLIHPLALRTGRENQLIEDGFYPSLEAAIDEFEDPNELYEAPAAMEPDNLDDPDVPLPTDPSQSFVKPKERKL